MRIQEKVQREKGVNSATASRRERERCWKKCCPCWKTTGQAVVSENSNRWIEKARQWRRAMREGFARRTKGAAVSEKWKTMFNWYYNPKLQRRSFGSPTCLLFGRRLFQPTLRRAWSFSKISVLKSFKYYY